MLIRVQIQSNNNNKKIQCIQIILFGGPAALEEKKRYDLHSVREFWGCLKCLDLDQDKQISEKPGSGCGYETVFRIRDVYLGSPDPTFFLSRIRIFWSRIRIKEFEYFDPKKWFIISRKYDPGCSSRIRILTFYPSRIQGSKRHRIRIRNTDPEQWIVCMGWPAGWEVRCMPPAGGAGRAPVRRAAPVRTAVRLPYRTGCKEFGLHFYSSSQSFWYG